MESLKELGNLTMLFLLISLNLLIQSVMPKMKFTKRNGKIDNFVALDVYIF